ERRNRRQTQAMLERLDKQSPAATQCILGDRARTNRELPEIRPAQPHPWHVLVPGQKEERPAWEMTTRPRIERRQRKIARFFGLPAPPFGCEEKRHFRGIRQEWRVC